MPRSSRYRKSFKSENGTFFRFDIIPGDNTVFNHSSATIEVLGEETILSISDIELGYRDELCFGFPEYTPLTVELNLATIPNDLKIYLATGFKEGTETSDLINSNLCILWSSADNITYNPIWVGSQTPQLTSNITISSNETSKTKIVFQPIQTTVLLRCKWSLLNKYFDDPDVVDFKDFDYYLQEYVYSHYEWEEFPAIIPPVAWTEPTIDLRLTNQFAATEDRPGDNLWVYPYKLREVFEVMRREIQAVFKYITRQSTTVARSSADKSTTYFGWEYDRYVGSEGVIKVRQAQDSTTDFYDRLGSYITFSNLFVPFIIDPGSNTFGDDLLLTKAKYAAEASTGTTAGGIFNINDTGSFPATYKTFVEFFVGMTEWACAKMQIDFSFTGGNLKMQFNVFGALERTNNTLPLTMKLFEISASESLTAEIGYICSSVETGNAKATPKLIQIAAQSPVLPDLAKSQTFSIKNCALSWDANIPEPVPTDLYKPTVGTFGYKVVSSVFKGFTFENKTNIPCTTLFYAQGTVKITEYMQAGDTTKGLSEGVIYYETDNFVPNHMEDLFVYTFAGPFPIVVFPRYLELFKWLSKWQILTGTATQFNKLFSKILTNPRNFVVKDCELYNNDLFDFGDPHKLLGHKIINDIPIEYDPLLELANKGVISSVKYELTTGKYTISTFQVGLLNF